jgi:hypothetical protein
MNKVLPTKSITTKTFPGGFGSAPRVITFIQTRGGIERPRLVTEAAVARRPPARLTSSRPQTSLIKIERGLTSFA